MHATAHCGLMLLKITSKLAVVAALAGIVHLQTVGTLVPVSWTSHGGGFSSSNTMVYPPLTGNDMVKYMDENAEQLRKALNNFDSLREMAAKFGDRPIIEMMWSNSVTPDAMNDR